MTVDFQGSLLDLADAETDGPEQPRVGPLAGTGPAGTVRRDELTRGAWVDVRPGWLTQAADLFARLVDEVPWRAERREMYDRVVDVPRLLCFYGEEDVLPDPVLGQCRDQLSAHYRRELGEAFVTAGLCLYRDGRDSVAWHGDTTGRGSREDTMATMVSSELPRPMVSPCQATLSRPSRYRHRPAVANSSPSSAR